MNKFLLLLLPLLLFSKSYIISDIPLPKLYIQNLDPYDCDEQCMQNYLDNGMIFYFLANAKQKLNNQTQNRIRAINISLLNLDIYQSGKSLRVAMILPYKKIGKYSSSTMNASFAYLITKNYPFELKGYKVESENIEDLEDIINTIKKDGFNYIIAPLTQYGADNISIINPNINIYFPTINKKNIITSSSFLFYGGIDYKAQSDLLLEKAVSPLVIFHDKSSLGNQLASYQETKFMDTNNSIYSDDNNSDEKSVIKFSIARRTTNLEKYLKENNKLSDGSFFLNTPIIKSGMVMSQLTLYDTNVTNILSTQINYNPLILSMTQYTDRKKMLITNSITEEDNLLIETNALLGNDIVFDWINYTTTIGIDYFFHLITGEERNYTIPIEDNQMVYKIELLRPSISRFIKYNY